MNNISGLSLAYINQRPESAARVLASRPIDESAALLASLPSQHAVKLLTGMNAAGAAALLCALETEIATRLLKDMDFVVAAQLLRRVSTAQRSRLVEALPRRQRNALELSLAYPSNTAGANMTTALDTLPPSATVSDAVQLKQAGDGAASDLVYVTDQHQVLVGVVTPIALIRQPGASRLADIADTSCVAVSPHVRLSQLADLDARSAFGYLPVVSRRGELLGALSRGAVRLFATPGPPGEAGSAASLAGSILDVMTQGAIGLVDLLMPRDESRRIRGGHDVR